MSDFEDTPRVTPEIIPNPDPHKSEMPPSMVDVDIEDFLKRQEEVDGIERKPGNKPLLQ